MFEFKYQSRGVPSGDHPTAAEAGASLPSNKIKSGQSAGAGKTLRAVVAALVVVAQTVGCVWVSEQAGKRQVGCELASSDEARCPPLLCPASPPGAPNHDDAPEKPL
jgi:hypothetical protein